MSAVLTIRDFASPRTVWVADRIREYLHNSDAGLGDPMTRKVLVVSESETRSQWLRDCLLREGHLPALPGGLYGSIDGIVERLARLPAQNLKIASALRTESWLRQVWRERGEPAPGRRGLQQIVSALARLRVTLAPDRRMPTLRKLIEEADQQSQHALYRRLQSLRQFYDHIEKAALAAGLVSAEDLEWLLAERADAIAKEFKFLLIEDIYRLGPAQQHLVRALAQRIPCTHFLIRKGPDALKQLSQAAPATCHEFLHTIATEVRDEREHNTPSTPGFSYEEDNPVAPASGVELLPATTQRDMDRRVILRVKQALAGGTPARDIAVGCVSQSQSENLADVLEQSGVTVRRQFRQPLADAPSVRAFVSLLEAWSQGLPREATLSALRNVWLNDWLQASVGTSDLYVWRHRVSVIARELRVIGGDSATDALKAWKEPLSTLKAHLAKGNRHSNVIEADIEVSEQLITLLGEFSALSEVRAAEAWCQLLQTLLYDLGLLKREALDPALSKLERALNELGSAAAMDPAPSKIGLRAMLADLRDAIDELSAPDRAAADAVMVGGLLDLRARERGVVIVAGLHDGELPFSEGDNLYLPAQLLGLSSEVPPDVLASLCGDLNPLEVYRHLLACLTDNPQLHLTLCWPTHVDECERAPALPLQEMLQASATSIPIATHSLPDATLLSTEELQVVLGSLQEVASQKCTDGLTPAWLRPALRGRQVTTSRDSIELVRSPWQGWLSEDVAQLVARDQFKPGQNEHEALARFSASRLENWAGCGTRYFLNYVCNAPEQVRPEVTEEASERGTLLHETLEAFLTQVGDDLRDVPKALVPKHRDVAEGRLQSLLTRPLADLALWQARSSVSLTSLLLKCFEEAADDMHVRAASFSRWRARVKRSLEQFDPEADNALTESELSAFLRWELRSQAGVDGIRLMPWLYELPFGSGDQALPPATLVFDEGRLTLLSTGFIDRVDVLLQGDNPIGIVVRDYKSGAGMHDVKLRDGLAFQLPLYAVAASSVSDLPIVGAFYQPLSITSEFKPLALHASPQLNGLVHAVCAAKKSKPAPELAVLLESLIPTRLHWVLTGIEDGNFYPSTLHAGSPCEWCSYRMACAVRLDKQTIHEQLASHMADAHGYYLPSAWESDPDDLADLPAEKEATR